MAALRVSPTAFGARLGGLPPGVRAASSRFRDASPFLKQVGALLLAASQRAFKLQRLGSQPWPARQVPNYHGAIRDLEKGPRVKDRRFDARPALFDTGFLRKSLAPATQSVYARPGATEVMVGTVVPYAGLHQFGGESSTPITPTVRKNLAKWLKKNKAMRPLFGFLFQLTEYVSNVRPRPFLGLTEETRDKIRRAGEGWFGGGRAGLSAIRRFTPGGAAAARVIP